MIRRFLSASAAGGGVSVNEVGYDTALESLVDPGKPFPEKIKLKSQASARVLSAKNGERFTAWHGETVIIVLVN